MAGVNLRSVADADLVCGRFALQHNRQSARYSATLSGSRQRPGAFRGQVASAGYPRLSQPLFRSREERLLWAFLCSDTDLGFPKNPIPPLQHGSLAQSRQSRQSSSIRSNFATRDDASRGS